MKAAAASEQPVPTVLVAGTFSIIATVASTQTARATSSEVGARHGLPALHEAQAALAITATTNTAKWTGEPTAYARCIDYLV
ncbi:MAG: hypothetical protein KBG15_09405 [Kofleriaceae bacterium]|nr:hypothetical protein [Kofleriaceae bacterium]